MLVAGCRLLDVGCVGWEVDGVEGFGAAEADGGIFFLLAYVGDVTPAAFALGLVRTLYASSNRELVSNRILNNTVGRFPPHARLRFEAINFTNDDF